MSNQKTPPTPSRGTRREELRRQQEAASARAGRLARATWIVGLAVIAVMAGIMVWAFTRPADPGAAAPGALVAPAGATDAGAVVVGQESAPVTVTIYADFMCPYCGQFERANGGDLAAAVSAGTAKLELHAMSFLDNASSGTRYSTRAANAFATVANADPAAAMAFYRLLFEQQPAENTPGLTDAQLTDLARQAGATEAVTASFAKGTYQPWIAQVTQKAWDSGVKGTPTVLINGQTFTGDLYTAGPLAAAITQAAGA